MAQTSEFVAANPARSASENVRLAMTLPRQHMLQPPLTRQSWLRQRPIVQDKHQKTLATTTIVKRETTKSGLNGLKP